MLTPNLHNLLDWQVGRLRQEEIDKSSHDENPTPEEAEDSVVEVAEHGEKALTDDEDEDEAHNQVDALSAD